VCGRKTQRACSKKGTFIHTILRLTVTVKQTHCFHMLGFFRFYLYVAAGRKQENMINADLAR